MTSLADILRWLSNGAPGAEPEDVPEEEWPEYTGKKPARVTRIRVEMEDNDE